MYPLTVVVAALLVVSASAQSFSALPLCAQNCTINAIPSSCNLDPKCICSDAGFIQAITCCVAGKCDQADQEATIKYADSICIPAGVTNLPTAAVCANSTGTATASSAISSAMSTASSAVSSASSAATSAQSVASHSATSAAAVPSSTGKGDAGKAFYAQGLGMMGAAVGAAVALM